MSGNINAQLQLGATVGAAIMAKSIEQFLEPGEELASVTSLRARSTNPLGGQLFWNWLKVTPDGLELSKHMAVAVTSRRVLVLRAGGRLTVEAREVASEAPIGEVREVEIEKSPTSTRVSWTVHGYRYTVKASRSETASLAQALESSRATKLDADSNDSVVR